MREFLEAAGKVLFLRNARSEPLILAPHQITERKLAAIEALRHAPIARRPNEAFTAGLTVPSIFEPLRRAPLNPPDAIASTGSPSQSVGSSIGAANNPSAPAASSSTPSADAAGADSFNESRQCCVCMDRERSAALLPCGHVCVCTECSERLRSRGQSCPICRSRIDTSVRLFYS